MIDGGAIYVVSAPSGAGKTSLVKEILGRNPRLGVAISHTTRPQRPNESNGQHYHFVDEDTFLQMVADGCFVEHANVFGHMYGTSRTALDSLAREGTDIVLEIDWQGAAQIRERVDRCHSIFILPPSKTALRQRLTNRGQDAAHIIERRLSASLLEISHYKDFDFLIVNDDFNQAVDDFTAILEEQPDHLALSHQEHSLADLLRELLAE